MQTAHKIELIPNNKQQTYFAKACGVSRFSYNWGVEKWNELYKQGVKGVNGYSLKKMFNAIKHEEFPWTGEVTKYASQQAFIDLQNGFTRFFNKTSAYPTFKKKGRHDSFYIGGDQLKVKGKYVHIPKLGKIHMAEELRFNGKINSATISRKADRWYIAIQVELADSSHLKRPEKESVVGVDLGIKSMATTSDGLAFSNLKSYKKQMAHLRKEQRKLSRKYKMFKTANGHLSAEEQRKQLWSQKNYQKQKMKVAKIHRKISNQRNDALHKFTTYLANNYTTIAIENLNVSGMIKNHNLALAITDVGMGKFRRLLEYKTAQRGTELKIVDRYYPSSKECSNCGAVKEVLPLNERVYRCGCGYESDRDLNAAVNLAKWKSPRGIAPPKVMPVDIIEIRKVVNPIDVRFVEEIGTSVAPGYKSEGTI
jgi:putative transposase